MLNFFSKNYFENWLKRAGPEIQDWFKKEVDYIEENIRPYSKILDVGCGFGRHIEILAPFAAEVVGIDNNKKMIKMAKRRLSKFENIKLYVQDAKKIDYPSNYFDYVICMTNTFGDFPDKKLAILKEMLRTCKRGGQVIISVYSDKAIEFRKKDYQAVGLHITAVQSGLVYTKEGLVSEQFSKLQLKNLFSEIKCKFKILDLTPISYLCKLTKR